MKEARKKKHSLQKSQNRFVFFSLTPIMLLFLAFGFIPIIMGISLSFYNYNPLSAHSQFLGLGNYKELFQDPVFLQTVLNTFKFVIFAVGANLIFATMIALAINSVINSAVKDLFRMVFFLPTVTPIVGAALVFTTMLDPSYGVLNVILGKFGVNSVINWLTDPRLVFPAIIVMTLWQDIGYNIIIIMAGLQGIPRMFHEAAYIDGANSRQTFWRVTFPLLKRTVLFVSVMTILSYFQVFAQVQVMTGGGPDYASEVFGLQIYDNAFRFMKMGYASAEAVVLLVIMLIISALQVKYVKADWEY